MAESAPMIAAARVAARSPHPPDPLAGPHGTRRAERVRLKTGVASAVSDPAASAAGAFDQVRLRPGGRV
jgi:hypothetical protein